MQCQVAHVLCLVRGFGVDLLPPPWAGGIGIGVAWWRRRRREWAKTPKRGSGVPGVWSGSPGLNFPPLFRPTCPFSPSLAARPLAHSFLCPQPMPQPRRLGNELGERREEQEESQAEEQGRGRGPRPRPPPRPRPLLLVPPR